MGTKVELHQFIDCAVDIHERKSTVNFVYLNRVLHELAKHCGISNLEVHTLVIRNYFMRLFIGPVGGGREISPLWMRSSVDYAKVCGMNCCTS